MREIHLERFDLNLLVVFDTMMRERHVGRAGEALGLTQPAVSHALTRLRHLLDDPLFVKHAKGMRPTPRAEALADTVSSALRTLRQALNKEQAFDPATAKRTIRIGGTDYIDLTLMPRLLPSIRETAPGFDIRLRPVSQESVLQELRRHELDIAIGPMTLAPEGVKLMPLFTERFVLIARQGHPALHGTLTPKAFAGLQHLLVSQKGDPTGIVDDVLREAGLSRRVAVTVPHFLAAPFVIGATDLVALVAERIALKLADTAGIALHEPPIPIPPWTVGLAHLPSAFSDPGIEWLVQQISRISGGI